MTWIDQLEPRQQREIAFARIYEKNFGHGTDGHSRLMLIAQLARLLDQLSGELQLARLRTPESAGATPALDTKIITDIADWAARHGLTLTDAALTEALQRVRDVHYQRLFVEEQLQALGWRPGGVNDPALLLGRKEGEQ